GAQLDRLLVPPTERDDASPPSTEPAALDATDARDRGAFVNEPHAELRRAPVRDQIRDAMHRATGEYPFVAPVLMEGQAVATAARVLCRSALSSPRGSHRAQVFVRGLGGIRRIVVFTVFIGRFC